MGYRSQVAYVIAFDEDSQAMGKFINYVMGSGDEHMITALKECEVDFETNRINFYQSDVKWYESYEDVKGHTRLYELVTDEETPFYPHAHARFIRIGEESGDIEENDYGDDPPWESFYPVVSMELPFSSNYEPYSKVLEQLIKDQPTKGETNEA